MDVCLPSIARYSGSDLVPLAILHGIVLEVCVPILVGAFADRRTVKRIDRKPLLSTSFPARENPLPGSFDCKQIFDKTGSGRFDMSPRLSSF